MEDAVVIGKEELQSAHMRAPEFGGEVLCGPECRRRWSTEEKLRILAQSVAPGSSPSLTCRLHGISSGQLYTWRKQFRTGELTGFIPVAVGSKPAAQLPPPAPIVDAPPVSSAPYSGGSIEVELPSGVKLRLTGDIGEAALRRVFVGTGVIGVPGRVQVYLACGTTDMRKGFDGLSALVQTTLKLDPHGGALFVFRGKRGDLIKVLWWDGQGLCLFSKRLERGRFIWPQAKDGSASITNAQLSMLLEGIDWRAPVRSWRSEAAC